MIEATGEPIKIHVGRSLQEVLLLRVIEVVDSFSWISGRSIAKQPAVRECIAHEFAFEERSLKLCFNGSERDLITNEFLASTPADQLTFPGSCLAVIDSACPQPAPNLPGPAIYPATKSRIERRR